MSVALSSVATTCPVHGRVMAQYRVECFWWECPAIVDCGHVVTREAVFGLEPPSETPPAVGTS